MNLLDSINYAEKLFRVARQSQRDFQEVSNRLGGLEVKTFPSTSADVPLLYAIADKVMPNIPWSIHDKPGEDPRIVINMRELRLKRPGHGGATGFQSQVAEGSIPSPVAKE